MISHVQLKIEIEHQTLENDCRDQESKEHTHFKSMWEMLF